MRASDLDPRRASRIVAIYVAAAAVWIVASGLIADGSTERLGISLATLEIVKGLLFVAVTGIVLGWSLRRWAARLQSAARAEQESADRMRRAEEMRSTFLTGVSHELRTPLTAIVGYALTVHERSHSLTKAQLEELSGRLAVSAGRLRRLVDDLLEVDRLMNGIGQVRTESTDLTALVRRVVDATDAGAHPIEVVGVRVVADVDAAKIERAVEHLLDNAVRHSGSGSTITVHVTGDAESSTLQVDDDGVGLPDALLGRVFDPFVQDPAAADRPSPGIGIGLTLVARFAALHNGTAEAENRPEGGARFTVQLPATATRAIAAEGV